MRAIQGPYYFLMIANLFDIALIVGHGVIFYLHSEKSSALLDLDLRSNDQFVDIRRAKKNGHTESCSRTLKKLLCVGGAWFCLIPE